jgi:mono/diheme cytochrome c family protein/plastocyanin
MLKFMRKEWLARIIVILLVAAAIGIPVVGWRQRSRGIVIHARMAETGGWTPENLTVQAGLPLHLRLTSDDVTHSFAIGQSDQPAVDVIPGEMTDVTLVFDQPGKYTFYCTRWCSVNHWRMRGVIEVTAPPGQASTSEAVEPPLYVRLGLDIDAQHTADILPAQKPSAGRGALNSQDVPAVYLTHAYYLSYSPVEFWHSLRAEPTLVRISDQDIWDLVAWVWQSNTTPQEIAEGQKLFTTNCSACHGEQGRGDGVFADTLAQSNSNNPTEMQAGDMPTKPANFTDPNAMLSASPAHLQGKIVRGGMGTSMPYWGPIFTEKQTWALVAYLWTFQFEMEKNP